MLESLGGAVETDMVVPATKQRIEEIGVKVILETARVHLNGQLIHSHNSNRQRFFLVVNGLCSLTCLDDLRETF